MKSYKEFINESWEIHSDVLDNLIDPIRNDIKDMLVDLVGYDIKFIPANMFPDSSMGFQLLIKRKGYYNDGTGPMPGNAVIDPVAIDEDILDEFRRLIHFIESEIGFYYNTISYYNYILTEKGFCHRGKDLFSSLTDQEGKKFIVSISMFFGNKIPWTKPKESTKTYTPVKESLDKFIMKYLKSFNESVLEDGEKFMSYYKDDIRDILVDFVFGYDIRFLLTNTYGYPLLQIQILPEGYPNHEDIDPVLIDADILDDFKRLVDFIKTEVGFSYSHSHYFIDNNYNSIKWDIFESSGSLVSMIQMYFDGSKTLKK